MTALLDITSVPGEVIENIQMAFRSSLTAETGLDEGQTDNTAKNQFVKAMRSKAKRSMLRYTTVFYQQPAQYISDWWLIG